MPFFGTTDEFEVDVDDLIYDDDPDEDDDSNGCTCYDCTRTRQRSRGGRSSLYDYSYKPSPVFHGDGPLFIGPEIEVEAGDADRDECINFAHEKLGELGYLKSDGSLEYGFEIVTHPMAYGWAMENFPWDMLTELKRMGCYTESSHTGLHVHVSRAGFSSPCHAYRWMKFVYRNQDPVSALARRRSSEWAAFSSDDRRNVKNYAKGEMGYTRYAAINPCNSNTFELRMFASSLKPERVQAAFGFAAASVEYTRRLSAADIAKNGGWTWRAFRNWVSDRPVYEPLAKQMEVLTCAF